MRNPRIRIAEFGLRNGVEIQSGVVIRPCYPRILPPHSKISRAVMFESRHLRLRLFKI